MAIRKRGPGRWQVRVRPFPEMTVPTKTAAETVELDLKLRKKLGHLHQEKPARFGDEKRPMPIPFISSTSANSRYGKSTGSSIRSPNESAATSMPPVANGRAPKWSER